MQPSTDNSAATTTSTTSSTTPLPVNKKKKLGSNRTTISTMAMLAFILLAISIFPSVASFVGGRGVLGENTVRLNSISPTCVQNDDFCDCGTDEPLTSACSMFAKGTPFVCRTKIENIQTSLPLSRVGDGVCDCCDGSDELMMQCPDTCDAVRAYIQMQKNRKEELKASSKAVKIKLLQEALPRLEVYRSVRGKGSFLMNQESAMIDARARLKGLEASEVKSKTAKSASEIKMKITERFGATGAVFQKTDLERVIAALAIRGGSEGIEAALLEVDERYTMPGPEPSDTDAMVVSSREYSLTVPEPVLINQRELTATGDSILSPSATTAAAIEDDKKPKVTPTVVKNMAGSLSLSRVAEADLYDLLAGFIARADARGGYSNVLSAFVDAGLEASVGVDVMDWTTSHETSLKSPEAEAARKRVADLEASIAQLKVDMKEADRALVISYGPEDLLFPLWGKCYSLMDKGYRYEVCPFQDARQNSAKLGQYRSHVFKQETHAATGDSETVVSMQFQDGDFCFATKKPRSMEVKLVCGMDTSLGGLVEPEVCSYFAVLQTPLLC